MPSVTKIDESHGVVIPVTILAQAGLTSGDSVVMVPLQDGVLITQENSASGRMVAEMLQSMDDWHETYHTLASERLG